MKNLTSQTLIFQRDDGTRFRLLPAVVTPMVEYKSAICRGFLDSVEVYARSGKKVNFNNIVLNRSEAPFIVEKEVFDALPDSAIEFITPDPFSTVQLELGFKVYKSFISKSDVEVIPFADN